MSYLSCSNKCSEQEQKVPCPGWDRGRRTFAVPPLLRRPLARAASWSANTLPRGNGRSRSTPTGSKAVGVPAPRCIRRRTLSPFHHTRGSLCSAMTGTGPLHHRMQGYCIRFCPSCQPLHPSFSFRSCRKGADSRAATARGRCRLCRRESTPHSLFAAAKRERAVDGPREKALSR